MADVTELNEVNPTQAPLNIAGKRLWTIQRLSEFRLGQTCLHSTLF